MGEVKYSMKARVKILVNGAAATLLTGAVAAGLIISSTGALQTKNNDVLAARELDETQEEMTREQEPQTEANAELVSAERYKLGMLWEHELTAKKTTEKSTESDEKNTENEKRSSSASSAQSPLASYFSDQALVNPNTVGNYLNVRVQADESAEVVNTIKAEELVSVLGEDGDWTKIGVDDMEGWVKTEYLLTGEEAAAYIQENGTLYARVTVPNMNIRLRPTTSADILDVAYEYDAYEVSLLESGWAYCVYDGPMKGYLSADCLAVSYSLGETWINTDIALTEDNAKQLGVAVSESSAENILLASANKVNTSTDISSDTTKEAAHSQEVLTVLSPDQVMAMASQAETVSSQQEESKVQQDTVPSSSAAAIENSTANSETAASSESAQQPSSEAVQPTVPETQPSTEAVTVTGIEAFYVGGTKSEGDVVYSNEVYIVAAYSDGNYATITEGWSSSDIGMMLHAGENVITLSYGGFSSNIVLTVAAASPAAPETQPAAPETQPAAPETQPVAPAPAPETQPAAPETQPAAPETQPAAPAPAPETQPAAPETQPAAPAPAPAPSGNGQSIVDYAMQWVGQCNYVWGGTNLTPGGGVDCSGFTMNVYAAFGISLPHYSGEQINYGQAVSYEQLQPGDLICFSGHVGIYIGGGMMVHAASAERGIVVDNVFYNKQPIGYRRLV